MFVQIIHLTALLFALFTAFASVARPAAFAQRLGLQVSGADGSNEVRSQYGGFFLAIALVQAAALAGWVQHQAAILLLCAVFGGLIAGRLFSLALDRSFIGYGPTIRLLFAIDSCGFAVSLLALNAAR